MSSKATIRGTTEAWESGQLGTDEKHVRRAPAELEAAVEEALAMQAISLRLPRSTIKAYKDLASIYGVGYQPLMRDAICRWAEAEMKQLLAGAAETRRQKAQEHKEAKPVMKRQSKSPAPAAEPPRKRAA